MKACWNLWSGKLEDSKAVATKDLWNYSLCSIIRIKVQKRESNFTVTILTGHLWISYPYCLHWWCIFQNISMTPQWENFYSGLQNFWDACKVSERTLWDDTCWFASNANIALNVWRTHKVKQDIAVKNTMYGAFNRSNGKFLVPPFSAGTESLKNRKEN